MIFDILFKQVILLILNIVISIFITFLLFMTIDLSYE